MTAGFLKTLDFIPSDRFLQFSSSNFDASLFNIFAPLAAGITLVFASAQKLLPGPELATLLAEEEISHLNIPPTPLKPTGRKTV